MRLVIDLQAAQASSIRRGVGRYSRGLAKAMIANNRGHDIILFLNDAFPDAVDELRAEFNSFMPQERILTWKGIEDVAMNRQDTAKRRRASELLRSTYLESLRPDAVHVASSFEGFHDDAVSSDPITEKRFLTVATIYDLIPLLYDQDYIADELTRKFYFQKLKDMMRVDLGLAISEASRQEAIKVLGFPEQAVVNVSGAADPCFRPLEVGAEVELDLRTRLGLSRPFVMYTGGPDKRKNAASLIRAYGQLAPDLRKSHQLAVVWNASDQDKASLWQLARGAGLDSDDVVLTGYVSDQDLIHLYNLCKVFCFPAWHEGFGLPVLRAMQCGAATIASDRSSLPEILGWEDALFNPWSEADVAQKLTAVLSDDGFRRRLAEHGLAKAAEFSWDRSAATAWHAMERSFDSSRRIEVTWSKRCCGGDTRRLAFVSSRLPGRAGMTDVASETIRTLSIRYEVDVLGPPEHLHGLSLEAGASVIRLDELIARYETYDHVVHYLCGERIDDWSLDLAVDRPGIITVDDFLLSGLAGRLAQEDEPRPTSNGAAPERTVDPREAGQRNGPVAKASAVVDALRAALGIVVHSKRAIDLASCVAEAGLAPAVQAVPLARGIQRPSDRTAARGTLGLDKDGFVMCVVGSQEATLQRRSIRAWASSLPGRSKASKLVFLDAPGSVRAAPGLLPSVEVEPLPDNIKITDVASLQEYRTYLAAADAALYLGPASYDGIADAVVDCLAAGLPTIIERGSMHDLPDDCVLTIEDGLPEQALTDAFDRLLRSSDGREDLGERARSYADRYRSPVVIADRYVQAITELSESSPTAARERALKRLTTDPLLEFGPDLDSLTVARAIHVNFPSPPGGRQVMVDISTLAKYDARTGIQRVVRNILMHLIDSPPDGWRIEPVYSTETEPGYKYARRYMGSMTGLEIPEALDPPVEYKNGDIFLGLDLEPLTAVKQMEALKCMRRFGVKMHFTIYDLIPALRPDVFTPEMTRYFVEWLRSLFAIVDGFICISKSVADELSDFLEGQSRTNARPTAISFFHLGADLDQGSASTGLPDDHERILARISAAPSFLMVATVEPRKGHAQVLSAFERLWAEGLEASLVIVGKEGWMVEALVQRIRSHPRLGTSLFWLEGISDEYLEKVFAACVCLVAASEAEGFGLPLVEAARHNLPIIARDIPIFREIAGEHAHYFQGTDPDGLAGAVRDWLNRFREGRNISSAGMRWLTWAQSAEELKQALLGAKPYKVWKPDGSVEEAINDPSQAGEARHGSMERGIESAPDAGEARHRTA